MSTNGDTYLECDDFDRLIIEHWIRTKEYSAKAIYKEKSKIETLTKGEQVLQATEIFIENNSLLLTSEEMVFTAAAMQTLQLALTISDKELIHTMTEELNEKTKRFAKRAMDKAVSEALRGK